MKYNFTCNMDKSFNTEWRSEFCLKSKSVTVCRKLVSYFDSFIQEFRESGTSSSFICLVYFTRKSIKVALHAQFLKLKEPFSKTFHRICEKIIKCKSVTPPRQVKMSSFPQKGSTLEDRSPYFLETEPKRLTVD